MRNCNTFLRKLAILQPQAVVVRVISRGVEGSKFAKAGILLNCSVSAKEAHRIALTADKQQTFRCDSLDIIPAVSPTQ